MKMIGTTFITFTGMPLQPKGIARKIMNDIKRGAWFQIGLFWHKKFRPKHFTAPGAIEYGYQRRSDGYIGRKLRTKGHRRPLEWSGESRRLTETRDVRPTSKGVRIVMRSNKFNFRSSPTAPHMRDEMTRISHAEKTEIERRLKILIERGIKQNRTKTTVRV